MNILKKYRQQERILPFTPPPEQIVLPPDGTYPPRLLVMPKQRNFFHSMSYWLYENKTLEIVPNLLVVTRIEGHCELSLLPQPNETVFLNGHSMNGVYRLKDGDFIHFGKDWRAIFQADPVKDRRSFIFTEDENLPTQNIPIELTAFIEESVIINSKGVSFNKHNDFILWDAISYVSIIKKPLQRTYTCTIYAIQNYEPIPLASNLQKIQYKDIRCLVRWLAINAPVNLTFETNIEEICDAFPEAYLDATWGKFIESLFQGKNEELVFRHFLYPEPNLRQKISLYWQTVGRPSSITIAFFWIVLLLSGANSILRALVASTLIWFSMFLFVSIMMTTFTWISWFYEKLKKLLVG